jgi:F420H(2)-dependent quinone reductase
MAIASEPNPAPKLSGQERFDLWVSRALPKLTGRANRLLTRLSGGKLGSRKRGIPIGLLTTTGRRSGRPRTTPLMYLHDGRRYLVVASNGGDDRPPAWLLNLEANPEASFEPNGRRLRVRGRIVDPGERSRLWPRLVDHNPLWAGVQTYTERETAVISLGPEPGDAGAAVFAGAETSHDERGGDE